jgi:hypothetical protein
MNIIDLRGWPLSTRAARASTYFELALRRSDTRLTTAFDTGFTLYVVTIIEIYSVKPAARSSPTATSVGHSTQSLLIGTLGARLSW